MKELLKLLFRAGIIVLTCIAPYVYLRHLQTIRNDVDYTKFTHRAKHLVLGVSRAKVGIVPQIVKKELGLEGQMLNLAFTTPESPYSPNYFKLVRRKLSRTSNHSGLFLLSVNPGNLGQSSYGGQADQPIYDLHIVNMNPNVEYLFRNINMDQSLLFDLINPSPDSLMAFRPHPDGWGERMRRSDIPDEEVIQKLSRMLTRRTFSQERLQVLRELIGYLQDYGDVVLVRLPVAPQVYDLEQRWNTDFDQIMEAYALEEGVFYLNYVDWGTAYEFSDPQHLLNTGAQAFSKDLAADLKALGLSD